MRKSSSLLPRKAEKNKSLPATLCLTGFPILSIIKTKRHCDKRFALVCFLKLFKNRHLAEWRFLRFVRCTVIVTVNGPTWNVIRISLTSFRRIDKPPTVFPVPFRLYSTRYTTFCQILFFKATKYPENT